ncbi:hypothetical protein [Bradyrhizobium sp. SZCCHNRI1058]|uniref:hypothetical protein n=1 Tax=Bradyrhizobium sp. SZCCHNRI1058 TaxID=3057279 RepID=UPI002915F46B|nr:hypothetical protein [Bradyrhizobium sp. SZCCHNRI1058]
MNKRKSNGSHKGNSAKPVVAKPVPMPKHADATARQKRARVLTEFVSSDADELQAVPETETRLPGRPAQETETILPPLPPLEPESAPARLPPLGELKPDAVQPVGAGTDSHESQPTPIAEARAADPSPVAGGPPPALAGMEACQTLLMEMTRDNLDLAASLATMRSPLSMFGVATTFAGRQIDIYRRFTKAVVEIATGPAKAR